MICHRLDFSSQVNARSFLTVVADFAPAGSVDRGPFFYLWIFAMIVSSCYTYTWDIRMDWGLMDANAGEENRSGYYFFSKNSFRGRYLLYRHLILKFWHNN